MSATRPLLCCCCCCCIFLLLLLLLPGRAESERLQPSDPWLSGVSSLLQDCPRTSQRLLASLAHCARRRALAAIDRILQDDTVPVVDGLDLVKYHQSDNSRQTINNSVTFSIRDLLRRIREADHRPTSEGGQGALQAADEEDRERQAEAGGWRAELIRRLARVLKTHAIRIDAERLAWPGSGAAGAGPVEPRGRRRRRRQMQMMPIVMMGVLLMGSVLIPMGFQFLAVLGGKALILAKMALMLSSIQGLKKIATNGVNYGLYHSPVPEAWHERSTAGVELPSYALGYANAGGAGYSPAPGYLDPASLGYLANRRSASGSAVQPNT